MYSLIRDSWPRWGGPYDSLLDLEKLFDGPNVAGGIIDMVQLPDIFLRHPTVLVQVKPITTRIRSSDKGMVYIFRMDSCRIDL
jgi:hypothetical protein